MKLDETTDADEETSSHTAKCASHTIKIGHCVPGSILSVQSNQNVESKTEKCGVQYCIFTSRNQLF